GCRSWGSAGRLASSLWAERGSAPCAHTGTADPVRKFFTETLFCSCVSAAGFADMDANLFEHRAGELELLRDVHPRRLAADADLESGEDGVAVAVDAEKFEAVEVVEVAHFRIELLEVGQAVVRAAERQRGGLVHHQLRVEAAWEVVELFLLADHGG